ncbi:MAG: chemotaxis protein CheA, partial [Thermodesulfobacteriota bacterium]
PAPASDTIAQFVLDSDDLLEKVERHLSGVGKDPEKNRERIGEVFPLIHSLQGHSGLLGLTSFERFSREMARFLDRFLNGPTEIGDTERDLLLKGVDLLQEGLWELSVRGTASFPEAAAFFPATAAGPDAGMIPDKPAESEVESISTLPGSAGLPSSLGVMRQDIRVDLGKLDLLINLVGELVTAESMVTRNTDLEGLTLTNFERATHSLRRIISELQDVAMSVRMIPLSGTFRRLNRLVRDLSSKTGKPVNLTVAGENTEVDKTVLEQIVDPLVHLIRNSVDHGIEPREIRRSKGKEASGMIRIEARQESGEILIRFSDDGAGLNPEKIRAQAVARGLAEADDLGARPDHEVYRFIFESGFSTQEDIADIPGRGIGMAVVKKNIERLRGRVDIASTPGEGTEVALRIPMSMAVMDGMLIRVGPVSYTLPIHTIRESFRPTPEQITTTLGGQEWVRVRDSFMPVIRLHRLYNLVPDTEALDQGILINAVSDSRHFCLFVDEIIGHHQAVIKSVPEYIGNTAGVSGCTILNNGEVGLILDMGGIMNLAERIHEEEKPRQAKTH